MRLEFVVCGPFAKDFCVDLFYNTTNRSARWLYAKLSTALTRQLLNDLLHTNERWLRRIPKAFLPLAIILTFLTPQRKCLWSRRLSLRSSDEAGVWVEWVTGETQLVSYRTKLEHGFSGEGGVWLWIVILLVVVMTHGTVNFIYNRDWY
jgi:hypothetical protein